MIRVVLPAHLKNLAHVSGEVHLDLAGFVTGPVPGDGPGTVDAAGPVTQRLVLDALEAKFPVLLGTIRDRRSGHRRAFVRFYACEEDLSNESPDEALPARVVAGEEPFIILGAMDGG